MDTDFKNEHMVFHDEPNITNITNNDDDNIINIDELQIFDILVIEDTFPEEKIFYSSYFVICNNLYNDIKNNNQILNFIIGLLLEIRHVINNTKNKSFDISRSIK